MLTLIVLVIAIVFIVLLAGWIWRAIASTPRDLAAMVGGADGLKAKVSGLEILVALLVAALVIWILA